MSPQSNPPTHRKDTLSDLAQDAVGVQTPHIRRPFGRRVAFWPRGRAGRVRFRHLLARELRPIHGFLVTHRRMFGTRHKHKQSYRG